MVIFHCYVKVHQRVNLHFPMVFLWFSYGFPIKTSIFLWFSFPFSGGGRQVSAKFFQKHNSLSLAEVRVLQGPVGEVRSFLRAELRRRSSTTQKVPIWGLYGDYMG